MKISLKDGEVKAGGNFKLIKKREGCLTAGLY